MRSLVATVAVAAIVLGLNVVPTSKPCHGRSCQSPSPSPTPSPTSSLWPFSGFVRRSGASLTLNGQPYTFSGINIYNANSRANCWYSLGNDDGALAATLADSGVRSFRAWFTQGEATTNGIRDWSAFDHTLAVARMAGIRVMPVLSVEDCRGEGVRLTDWYASGYRADIIAGHTTTFRDYVSQIVTRYRDDPAILVWQIGNEMDTMKNADGTCGPASTLDAFAADIAGLIKSIDPNHLVSVGTIGDGQCAASGSTAYRALHAPASIDLCEFHDYKPDALPNDPWNGLTVRLNDCASLGKPLFIGETGIVASDSNRASEMAAKADAQFGAGVVGWLPWDWRAAGRTDGDAYVIGPGDPTLAVIASH